MTFNKKLLAGLVSLAAASAANATVVVGGDNGFEFSVDGEINQFYVYSKDKGVTGPSTKVSEVRDGLLPAFFGFNVKAPTTNGLDIAARVSISPSTNGLSYPNAFGGAAMEQREAFFTVDGSFGQILAGKALGLYGSHNILTDQTLYGVGYGVGGNGQTTLGRINLGYDYANWRSQIKWTSADMSGFKVALAVVDPNTDISIGSNNDQKNPRFEGDLSYAGNFDGGSTLLWVSGMTQSNDGVVKTDRAWTVGGTVNFAGFEAMAQYSKSKQGDVAGNTALVTKYDQYILQAGYNFGQGTRLVGGYSQRNNKNALAGDKEMWTIGVYHDVTANLKLVAEFSNVQDTHSSVRNAAGGQDQDIFSVGGFVSW